ncbi:MAG: hypothetical protein J6A09_06225, partial [Alphaproteobacteria bacterium]|nr:hypothetical protein [Alphaproteobacteria bacterium]
MDSYHNLRDLAYCPHLGSSNPQGAVHNNSHIPVDLDSYRNRPALVFDSSNPPDAARNNSRTPVDSDSYRNRPAL